MKKFWLLLLLLSGLLYGCGRINAGASRRSVSGTVADMTEETLVLETEDGFLAFSADIPALRAKGVSPGVRVRLRLMGRLQPEQLWQSAKITGCRVLSGGAAPESAESALQPSEPAQAVDALLQSMSTEEKITQLFLIRCPVTDAPDVIARLQPGGITLYAENTASKDAASLRRELELLQSLSRVPMLVAVDEEGGIVNRLSCFPAYRSAPFPTGRTAYHSGGWDAVTGLCAEQAELFRSVGVNVNLAPVCDVCGDAESYMYPRSFGGDARLDAEYVRCVVEAYGNTRIGCVLKHFPGYGDNTDTHSAAAVDTRTLDELEGRDLLPFAAGIRSGAGAVLVAHTVVCALDGERPASLSPAVCAYLREKMGFQGVIITDDLFMQAARGGETAPAVEALLAGCDLLCCSDWEYELAAVREAAASGLISAERLDSSVRRVLLWKLRLGLLG